MKYLFIVTDDGWGKKVDMPGGRPEPGVTLPGPNVKLDDIVGFKALPRALKSEALYGVCRWFKAFEVKDSDDIFLFTTNGRVLRFHSTDLRSMGKLATGVSVINLNLSKDDWIVSAGIYADVSDVFSRLPVQHRGSSGLEGMECLAKGMTASKLKKLLVSLRNEAAG